MDAPALDAAGSNEFITAILVALAKVRLIFREFMRARSAPPLLRRLTHSLVLLIGGALLASYFTGLAMH